MNMEIELPGGKIEFHANDLDNIKALRTNTEGGKKSTRWKRR